LFERRARWLERQGVGTKRGAENSLLEPGR